MTLAVLGGAVLLLLLLIVRLKFNAFLALILTSFVVGVLNGMPAGAVLQSILKGIGDTMGGLALILAFGAILGKMIEESGAAHSISFALTRLFGQRRIQVSVLITGFLVGLPMIYNASFLVLIPLIYTLSATTGLPLMYLGIPLSSALSVTHGYLPPHPAPTSIAILYKADPNLTLLYGLLLAVPATILAGPVLARFFRHLKNTPPPDLYVPREFKAAELPGLAVSLLTVLTPVLLMLVGALVALSGAGGAAASAAKFASDPTVALLLAVLLAFYTLGLARGRDMDVLMKSVGAAAASVSMVLLIIAAGGAFKQVLLDAGTGNAIKDVATKLPVSPLILAWSASALLRLALGSATVAAITAAGVVLPLVRGSGVAPELLVLATTAGSLMFSHFNDIGFWMFKEYYNVTVKQTFQVWTVMESIVAIVGLLGTLALATVIRAEPAPKRVFYVNSYHEGYGSSDDVMAGLKAVLGAKGVSMQTLFLDAKRDPAGVAERAAKVVEAIRAAKPDVLIVSDDDAVKHVVAPHFKNGPMPVVFCGVNWDASPYALPREFVTGMVEVVPIEDTLREVRRQKPTARRLVVLSEESVSERNNTQILDAKYRALGWEPEYRLVTNFEDWKKAFVEAQAADAIYLPTNGAIQGWNAAEGRAWAKRHTQRPVVTCDDFMMAYAGFGLTKVAREQGEWAAETAAALLAGKRAAEVAVTANRKSRCYWNTALGEKGGLRRPHGRDCAERDR
ncbi:MAG: gluconate:H+ symporter [Bryobacteraceae bacterium]|nr:gluconate:H+ symporter [Bryobacteraceae bacterium]